MIIDSHVHIGGEAYKDLMYRNALEIFHINRFQREQV